MELSYKEKTIKYVIYCLVITAAALLQHVLAVRLSIGGARCFLVLPVTLVLAISEHERAAALLGLYGGALIDMFASRFQCYSALFLMLGCFLIAALVEYLFRNTFLFTLLAATILIAFYILLYWVFFVLIKSSDGAGAVLAHFYLPCMLYTVLAIPAVYFLLAPLQKKLNKKDTVEV